MAIPEFYLAVATYAMPPFMAVLMVTVLVMGWVLIAFGYMIFIDWRDGRKKKERR